MPFELQPRIQNKLVRLEPLVLTDFEAMYRVAADPLIWEQHPSRERYKRDVFSNYFKGAIDSGGASRVIDSQSGELFGCSRFYDLDEDKGQVSIGYTFIARSHWGRGFNGALKALMLNHAFKFVGRVIFQVGVNNWRSRKAMEKLGAKYMGEEQVAYVGEVATPNVIYQIESGDWARKSA